MCGRYVSSASTANLFDAFDVEEVVGEQPPPSWNVAPTDPVRAILQRVPKEEHTESAEPGTSAAPHPVRQLRALRWGLVPSWSKDPKGGARMINARIETVTEKPAFKKAAARRRCLIPAEGYYEWQKTDTGKVPYFLHDPDGRMLAMAGLYELWREPLLAEDDPNRWLWSCTIITQQAPDLLGEIHDRNPVMVPADLQAAWLDCSSDDPATARQILDQIPEIRLEPRVVSAAVGNVRNDGPQLIEPVTVAEQERLPL
jgi:putative SOS response-associated peptidase YedK